MVYVEIIVDRVNIEFGLCYLYYTYKVYQILDTIQFIFFDNFNGTYCINFTHMIKKNNYNIYKII